MWIAYQSYVAKILRATSLNNFTTLYFKTTYSTSFFSLGVSVLVSSYLSGGSLAEADVQNALFVVFLALFSDVIFFSSSYFMKAHIKFKHFSNSPLIQ